MDGRPSDYPAEKTWATNLVKVPDVRRAKFQTVTAKKISIRLHPHESKIIMRHIDLNHPLNNPEHRPDIILCICLCINLIVYHTNGGRFCIRGQKIGLIVAPG